ncbi:MAG: hypothetical protein GVY10_01855 [Verrucomicrobia bacterium]|jgi:hypothetical protein|nr:hypothetical protein [Verrucomicrobiota bacterium]
MMKRRRIFMPLVLLCLATTLAAGPAGTAIRETAEAILGKFGRGAAGQTAEEVAEKTARAVATHGEDALPFLRGAGHRGFAVLREAGEQAPEVLGLYARRGDEALWIVSEPRKLALFLQHGDTAADAMLRHPAIADSLIRQFGDEGAAALLQLSRQNAQRLKITVEEGLFRAAPRGPELLGVIRRHGNSAMDFIWRHKGALALTGILATFLADPQPYISGAKELVVEPVVQPIAEGLNWTLLLLAVLLLVFLPTILRGLLRSVRVVIGK